MENEFSRTELLLGHVSMEKLRNSHVLVFGVGGVGSHCIEALARSGIGTFTLVDNDVVSLTNINRQSIAYHSTVGQYKTQVMKDRILDINPEARVTAREQFVLSDDIGGMLEARPDYIVDAIDTVTAKVSLAVMAEERDIPIISSMGTGNKLDPSAFEIADIYETSVCPLCRVMRRELKKRGVKRLTVLYSKEEPAVICPAGAEMETKGASGRPAPGSVSFVPPVAGLLMAGYVVRRLAGV
ncbi:tRNA threonylcarbamoyladenosine dehydratase [Qiania dongpingensis]|uniref:tRNA threonylcarbamoyladenosine dehydratase n=1 Tax=Qiania dongpingensis TaxID=2763669 RepID=A0A7G9G1T3_9FIRM|nr:tRNA threonylcarbamoyladenosine dehydratase [Qiania dongpingensis]QNM04765.1 tRNA threonylcarbamoyladenosine dehydratase [Qiania dongpingensis]